ncbi:MAG: hypothetical protein Ct9H300mP9_5940 [Candidatus Neomarinimicrobiota bacterium]|nr:MAG: hypothetical protein Ct9H300mP9_5940 [Candidatus Neomarinimicrobiota bacterium]
MQAPAAPNEYPQDPETEPLRDEQLPSERKSPKPSSEPTGKQQGHLRSWRKQARTLILHRYLQRRSDVPKYFIRVFR